MSIGLRCVYWLRSSPLSWKPGRGFWDNRPMPTPPSGSLTEALDLKDLVKTALNQDRRAGLSEILSVMVRSVGAQACILWQETPFARNGEESNSGELFVLADWVSVGKRSSFYNLSLEGSATGEAILRDEPVLVKDVRSDHRVDRQDPFLGELDVLTFCSFPVRFLDGKRGALNVYRTKNRVFGGEEMDRLSVMVELLPQLYQTISDKISYGLVERVNRILQEGTQSEMASAAHEVCREVADVLQVVEVSLFLSSFETPKRFEMRGTTWDLEQQPFKKEYLADKREGLTGWVLSEKSPVWIFDLRKFKKDREQISKLYPGIHWGDSLEIEKNLKYQIRTEENIIHQLEIIEKQRDQPLSFMAAPVVVGRHLLGALRCCTAQEGPFYFSEREVMLLQLVADQVGQAWNNWLRRKELERENVSWQQCIRGIARLNRRVQKQLKRTNPDEGSILQSALSTVHKSISNAEISDIRLVSEDKKELYYAHRIGSAWQEGAPHEVRERKEKRFRIDECQPSSTGSYVVKHNKLKLIEDSRSPDIPHDPIFKNSRRMIVAPISVADQVFGVLDILDTGERTFPVYAIPIARLLGQQIGLYKYLFKTVSDLQRLSKQQVQIFEDFTHQLRSPISQVHVRSQICVRLAEGKLEKQLMALRGLAAKARRVTRSLSLFARLAEEKKLKVNPTRIQERYLTKMLIETMLDLRSIQDPDRKLGFTVQPEGFKVLRANPVFADRDFLWHAVNNVLDNAAKYSFPNTQIRIFGGLTGSNRFHITVVNKGIALTTEEIRQCTKRGWRSGTATNVVGEGSGIGLWIVHHIMEAHGGELMLLPTTSAGWTEVKLIFPKGRET